MSTVIDHELKILDLYFDSVAQGMKTAELRNNDRKFVVSDLLKLREIDAQHNYTGRSVLAIVRDVADVSFLIPNYVLLSIKVI